MIQIAIHVLPQEIDQLEQTLIQLKRNSTLFNSINDNFLVDVVLNLNLVDWNKSVIPKSFFINKFNQLEQLTKTWANTKFETNEDGTIQGCVSHRRKVFKETKSEAVLILDTDFIFSENLLYYMYHSWQHISSQNSNFIITPQIPKGWDASWDVLVNINYLANNDREYLTRDPYYYAKTLNEVSIKQLDNFKFGGGWATLISTPLIKMIQIPESLGHYGLEDTYIMLCASLLKHDGKDIKQYVIENEIICEDHIFRFNPYNNYLTLINKQEEFKKIANENFQKEIKKFGDSLKN